MQITFLGTGTSQGIPVINCPCQVCRSDEAKNKRLRTSISVQTPDLSLLVDTTTDLRLQLLNNPLPEVNAILYTHAHADHVNGLDDLRPFNWASNKRIPAFGDTQTLNRLKLVFDYAFGSGPLSPGIPNLEAYPVRERFQLDGLSIIPLELMHGDTPVYGYRIKNFAYCTDVSFIPEKTYEKLTGLEILVLGALRERPHPTHFSLSEAIVAAEKIGAEKTYFIHMCHEIDHTSTEENLPQNMYLAYDGLILEC